MDRSTTKAEYKAFMRKWRAVVVNCGMPDNAWKRQKDVQEDARIIAFTAVYKVVPRIFWDLQRQDMKIYRDPKEEALPEICMKMNTEHYCPNSYPHKTRNP